MIENLEEAFEKFDNEYSQFNRIENPESSRPDLCAFMLLNRLVPSDRDIVSAAEHDEIFLGVNCEQLAAVATEEDVLLLVRCGIRYEIEYGCLALFV